MAEFDEASFQTNFLAELRDLYGAAIVGATRTPPQGMERDLGFDAMLRIELGARVVPVFIQFKAPKVVRMKSSDSDCWSYFGGVHYRFGLHKDAKAKRDSSLPLHRQHNLLVILGRRGHVVLYASPQFHTDRDFNTFVDDHLLRERTFYVDPQEIGFVHDRDEHHVSYSVTGTHWAFHSEFQPKGAPPTWRSLVEDSEATPLDIDPGSLRELARELRDVVEGEYARRDAGGSLEDVTGEPPEDTLALVRWTATTLDEQFGAALALLPLSPWGVRHPFAEFSGQPWWRAR